DALAPWTQTPIPPPPECEMPQFSLAAVPRAPSGEGGSSASKPASDVPPSPPPRKAWQVAGASTATNTATNSAPEVVSAPRPAPAPATVKIPPPPAPVVSAVNGAARMPAVPAVELTPPSVKPSQRAPARPAPQPRP